MVEPKYRSGPRGVRGPQNTTCVERHSVPRVETLPLRGQTSILQQQLGDENKREKKFDAKQPTIMYSSISIRRHESDRHPLCAC